MTNREAKDGGAPHPLDLASRVARWAELSALVMAEGSFSQHAGEPEDEPGVKAAVVYEHAGERLLVKLEIGVLTPTPRSSSAVSVKATYDINYEIGADDSDLASQEIEAFAKINSIFNAWPLFREFVQSCTMRMGLPPLTLPLITAGVAAELAGFPSPGMADSQRDKGKKKVVRKRAAKKGTKQA